jgi:hypothetical protein
MVVCASCAPAPSGCELPAARRHLLKVFLVAVVTFNARCNETGRYGDPTVGPTECGGGPLTLTLSR